MTTRHFWTALRCFLFCVLCGGIVSSGLPAQASSGSHVYRASVSPRPKADVPVQAEATPPVAQPKTSETMPAPATREAAGQQAVPAKAAKPLAPAKADTKSGPAKSAAKKPEPAKSNAKKSAPATAAAKAEPATKQRAATSKAGTAAADGKAASTKPAGKKDLHLNVKSAILINMTTGQVYYELNADKAIPPASITKLLTLYLVREAMAQGKLSPRTAIPVSSRAVQTGGSRMKLKRGEKVPLDELIKGISVVSANNACVAVAEYLGKGDPSTFVSQMNAKAKKIGMTNSRFHNPNGLPAAGQLSTARDLAKLSMSYLRTFPESLTVHSMTSHTYHGSTHRNANSLLRTYKGVDGLKTGFVCASGYNITATAKRGKTRLLAVVLGAQNSVIRQVETARLLDYGFKRAAGDDALGNRAEAPAGKSKSS